MSRRRIWVAFLPRLDLGAFVATTLGPELRRDGVRAAWVEEVLAEAGAGLVMIYEDWFGGARLELLGP